VAAQSTEESASPSDGSPTDLDVIKKQIASAWIAELTMKTKSVICPLTVDLTKPILQDKLPFYCVHSVSGAGGAELGLLARFLTSEQPFFAIQTPIGLRRQEFAKSINSLSEYYCNALLTFHKTHYGEAQFILGGWSAGAIIALEMAQRLARVRQSPALLVAIDKAPRNTKAEIDPVRNSFFRNLYLWWQLKWRKRSSLQDFANSLFRKVSWYLRNQTIYGSESSVSDKFNHLNQLIESTRTRDEREFVEALWEELEKYVPLPYDGKVLVLMTQDGSVDRVAEGWKAIAKQPRIVKVPGTHTSIIRGNVTNGVVGLADVQSFAEVLRWELVARGVRSSDVHRRAYEGARATYLKLDPEAPVEWLAAAARACRPEGCDYAL
jgi:thioesterase domain-containing protein